MRKLVASKFGGRIRTLFLCCLAVTMTMLLGLQARADRSLRQQDPAWMYEKAGEYAKAALYWHRAMRGVSEVWIPVMWGDVSNAPGKWKEYRNFVPEYRARLEKCLRLGEVSQAQRALIEFTNEIWMDELIEQEDGGFRASCGIRAEEAEKYGDFVLAEVLRRGQARLFSLVAAPYHEKAASKCQKLGRHKEAALHLQTAKAYEQEAMEAEKLAKGDEMLSKIPGFGGKSPWTGIELGRVTSTVIRDAYYRRVLNARGERQTEMTPKQVAATLKDRGLSHNEDDARYAAITVLASLGEKEALISALDDASAAVRLVAAKALIAIRWAEGWAACANHRDAAVRALIAPLLKPAEEDMLLRTYIITELMDGLDSASADTRSFCQNVLERITGQELQGDAWSDWWKELGDALPGIVRTGPGTPPKMDEHIDFGIWWQSGFGSIQHRPNALSEYQLPATIQWQGHLVVTQPGQYRFYVRNRGESIRSGRRVRTPGRYSFPAYFPAQFVKLEIDGRTLLPGPDTDVVEDPSAWVRLDFTSPIRLESGLHDVRLAFNIQSYDDIDGASKSGIWGGTPCVRLYWSSDHFLRELVSADHLVHLESWRVGIKPDNMKQGGQE